MYKICDVWSNSRQNEKTKTKTKYTFMTFECIIFGFWLSIVASKKIIILFIFFFFDKKHKNTHEKHIKHISE